MKTMHDFVHDFDTVTPEIWLGNETAWKERLLKLPHWYQIPLLNSNASHNLPDGSLVRFRGMIQDMYNPEFYFERFEVFNSVTNEVKTKSGKYCDTAHILENEKINYTENLQSAQRQTLFVISMPGLNEWAQKEEDKLNHIKHLEEQPSSSKRLNISTKLKRSYDETEEDSEAMDTADRDNSKPKEAKMQEATAPVSSVVSREHLLNFPLPEMPSQSCIVKIYDDSDELKLNDMVEIVGFLSVDPALSAEFQGEKDSLLEPDIESAAETITHNPPPSLIPRLHAVHVKKLEHCNPLIQNDLQGTESDINEVITAREHLLKALTELLLGDKLAAEYLICHLIASVYLRQDILALGQFCLNISNLPIKMYPNYAKQLYDIIKQFVTKSYYLPMTLENLNTLTLVPKKDYECNRLTSGLLQLSKSTHLILDETAMEQGQLTSTGLRNVSALSNLILHQRVDYDFKYYKMEFECDIPVLVLSEGKSMLSNDYLVPLRPEESSLKIFGAIVEAATYYLKEDIMNMIRIYLTKLKLVKYTLGEHVQYVEDDFLGMRRNSDSENPTTANDLHQHLVLARVLCLTRGYSSLNKECWDIAKSMETERRRRVKSTFTPSL